MAIDSSRGVALGRLRGGGARIVDVVVESGAGDAVAGVRDVRERPGRAGRPEHVRPARHEGASVLRAHRHERPRLRHVPPAIRRHVVVGAQHSRALDGHRREGSAVCGRGWHELPQPAAGRLAVSFTAARSRPLPRRAAVAAAACRWHAHRSGVHDRSRARSERLQYRSALRAEQRDADDLGLSAVRAPRPTRSTRRTRISASARSSARTACRRRRTRRPASRRA